MQIYKKIIIHNKKSEFPEFCQEFHVNTQGQTLTDILRPTRCGGPRRGKLGIKVSAKITKYPIYKVYVFCQEQHMR